MLSVLLVKLTQRATQLGVDRVAETKIMPKSVISQRRCYEEKNFAASKGRSFHLLSLTGGVNYEVIT